MTREIVRSFILQYNRPKRPPVRQIAENVGISLSTANKLLKKLRDGVYDYGEDVVFIPEKRGRKTKMAKAIRARVVAILTSEPTMTLGRAKELLAADGIDISVSTIWRIAKKEHISIQKISPKPGVVFDARITEARHDYAQEVNEMPDEELWFLDESGFNLHIAPLRCWSRVGRTPVVRVPTNREKSVSLLMCIAPDGIKYCKIKVGSFKAVDFVEELANRFEEVELGRVSLVMDNARIHHAREAMGFMVQNGIKHSTCRPTRPT